MKHWQLLINHIHNFFLNKIFMKRMNFTFNQTLERNPNSLNLLIPLKSVFSKGNLRMIACVLFLSFLGINNGQAQATECQPCNFTPLFPETTTVLDLSFVTVGLDLNQPIQDALQPLYDAVYDELGQDFDVTGLIALALSTQYNNELLCPGETITLDYKAIDIKEVLIDFDLSQIVNTQVITDNMTFGDGEEFFIFMDALGITLPVIDGNLEGLCGGDAACEALLPSIDFTLIDLQSEIDVDLYDIIDAAVENAVIGIIDPLLDGLQDIVGEVFDLDGGSHLDIFVDTDGDGNFDTQVLDTDDLNFAIDFNAPNAGLIETGSVSTPVNLTEDGNITARILLNGMGDTDIACPCPTQEFFHFGIDVDVPVIGIDVGISLDFNYYIANSFDLVIPVNIDDSSPTLETAPQNTTVECDGLGNIAALQTWLDANGNAVALDDCPNALVWSSPSLLSETDLCAPTNVYQYEFTVSDAAGNSSSSTATFTITDNTAPVIIEGADLNVECDQINAGNDDELLSWLNNNAGATATETCSNVTWTNNYHTDNWVNDCGETRHVDVIFTATDDCGNSSFITKTFATEDTTAPVFANCHGVITENAEANHCDAYVNFSAVIATDNCDPDVTITRLDITGLNSGDRFPVGTSILIYEAIDDCDNIETCTLKVVVNDYWTAPEISACPADIVQDNDPWLCSAVVNNIGIIDNVSDNCLDNITITYGIYADAGLTQLSACGVYDASGNAFPVGESFVKYTVIDQPLLLISEVTQSTVLDQIELTNFSGADVDLSCLVVTRTSTGGIVDETIIVPTSSNPIISSGGVFVIDFANDAGIGTGTCYTLSYGGEIIDEVCLNGFVGTDFTGNIPGDDVIRNCEVDTDAFADWDIAAVCSALTIGFLNPGFEVMPANGTLTSLQSTEPGMAMCSFSVKIADAEDPFCGVLAEVNTFTGGAIDPLSSDLCNESIIAVTTDCIVGAMIVNWEGTATPANSTISLTSPSGKVVSVTTLPADLSIDFFAEKTLGAWVLNVAPNAGAIVTVASWNLEITCLAEYDMVDVVLDNDLGLCSAEFTWTHPYFVDNCFEGTISVAYSSTDPDCVLPTNETLITIGGYETTQVFCVGTTTVKYTLIDIAGNESMCSFDVTVLDAEDPIIVCPADMTIHLDPGACRITLSYEPVSATDNCAVVDTVMTPLSGSDFEIGTTTVTMTISDAAGNTATCSYTVTVVEFVPTSFDLTCNSLVNVSLDENCEALVTADMILEGNNYGCYEDYIITVIDTAGIVVDNNLLGLAQVGTTLTVSIIDPETGNSCWGEIYVEDKLIPTFDCPASLDVTCNGATDPSITGEPNLTSCEISVTIEFEDDYTDFGCAGAPDDSSVRARIVRTWTVTDESGNADQCVQNINILKPVLADVVFPSNLDEFNGSVLDCGAVAANPALTGPNFTGYPAYANQNVVPGGLCAFSIGYQDLELEICAGGSSYEIIRTWTVRNMCEPLVAGVNPIQHLQSIKVLDTTGPALTCPAPITLIPGSSTCEVSVTLPAATVSDDCSGYDVYIETSYGFIYSNGGLMDELYGLGDHTVTYYATDACGNISSCEYTFTVQDLTAPISICDENTTVALDNSGSATVAAITFDDGSFDNCSEVTFEVRKVINSCDPTNTAFGSSVSFCCAEVGTVVMVELSVTDEAGNTNFCMVEVEVQDKIDPTVICPADKNVECSENYLDFIEVGEPLPQAAIDVNGAAIAIDNCPDVILVSNVISNTIECGNGIITTVWTATDAGGRTSYCIQRYFVENNNPFEEADITWPLDYEATTCGTGLEPADLSSPYDYPVVDEGACNNVAIGHDDQVLDFGAADACLKILRKWYVIDWCQASVNQDPTVPGPGVWHYTQVIKVVNSNDPNVTVVNFPSVIDNYEVNCGSTFAAFEITADDDCTPPADLQVTWEFSTGLTGSGLSASGAFANGSYSLTFIVSDLCGNTVSETHDFTVVDAKQPTPVCIFGIATTVMPSTGSVTIWASDFESGSSYDNCTSYDDLVFSFSADPNDASMVIDCNSILTDGLVPVTLHVTDEVGNTDFCSTFIDVQDPNGACGTPTALINGRIENENQELIEEVTVTLSDAAGMNLPVITEADGTFQFNYGYGDFDVTPEKNINYLNGVTTYDLVLITKHILGLELLDSPYKVIAADANNSQSISTLDIVKLRSLILYIDTELANNTSWRFIDANHIFTNTVNPWETTFPEYISLDGSNLAPVNFSALKVGDVNGSAIPNSLLGSDTRNYNGDLALSLEATQVASREVFTVDFKANDFNNIEGYQFTLGFDDHAVEFVDVVSNLAGLSIKNFGLTRLNEGVITTSWNSNQGVTVADHEVLFSITFRANAAINTRELFSINSRYTESEAYDGTDLYNVVLEFNGNRVSNGFELYQNTPNPFKAETTIGFTMPAAGAVTLTIYDISGRVLRLIEMDAVKGTNAINVTRDGIDATGVLYYQLETATETATKKMILVD
jgi:hypothetical protein